MKGCKELCRYLTLPASEPFHKSELYLLASIAKGNRQRHRKHVESFAQSYKDDAAVFTRGWIPTLHYITLHNTRIHYTTLHYTTVYCTPLQYTTLHCTALHYTTVHYTELNYTAQQYSTINHTTLQYTGLQNTTLHYTALPHTLH